MWVSFSKTKVMTVTDIANTAKNPVLIPSIRKIIDAASPVLVAWEIDEKSIFSGDAKRGTLKMAFTKNIINKEIETFFTLFCNLGKRTRIARPKIIPCTNPITKATEIAIREKVGSWSRSTRNETKAIASKNLSSRYNISYKLEKYGKITKKFSSRNQNLKF